MTNEERQKLCAELSNLPGCFLPQGLANRAADEIERLAAENRKLKRELDYSWRRIEAETGAKE